MTNAEQVLLFTATVILPTLSWLGLLGLVWMLYRRSVRVGREIQKAGAGGNFASCDRCLETLAKMEEEDALSKLESLRNLPHNWDNRGAKPPHPTAIERAKRCIEASDDMPTLIVPQNDGGIGFVWQAEHVEVELGIDADGTVVLTAHASDETLDHMVVIEVPL